MNSFRFSASFQLKEHPAEEEIFTLFAYDSKIGISIDRIGGITSINVVKTDEAVPAFKIISTQLVNVEVRLVVFLQVTSSEAHLVVRKWKRYDREPQHKWKYSFSKSSPPDLIFFEFWILLQSQSLSFILKSMISVV